MEFPSAESAYAKALRCDATKVAATVALARVCEPDGEGRPCRKLVSALGFMDAYEMIHSTSRAYLSLYPKKQRLRPRSYLTLHADVGEPLVRIRMGPEIANKRTSGTNQGRTSIRRGSRTVERRSSPVGGPC